MAEEKKTSKKAEKQDEKAAKPKKKSKKNPFKSIASFFKSVKSEGKKVVWAKPKEVLRNTIIVLIVCVIAGVAIYAVDTVLSLTMKGVKNLADREPTTVSQEVDETADTDEAVDSAETDDTADTTDEAETEATE